MPNDLSNKAFKSLVLTKVIWDKNENDSYIDYFLPFLATLIIKKQYKNISENIEEKNITNIKQIIFDFKTEFGLNIPILPMQLLIQRAVKKKILERKNSCIALPTKEIYKYDFEDKAQKQVLKYEKIIQEYICYSKNNYKLEIDELEAKNVLISFLERYGLNIISIKYKKSNITDINSCNKKDFFTFSKFIQSMYAKNQELFNLFVDISTAYVLTTAIFYEENLANYTQPKLNNLSIYLDTPLIMRFLGTEGKEIMEIYETLVDECKKMGIKLFIFTHTYEEIQQVLNNCLFNISNANSDYSKNGRALDYFNSIGYGASELQLFIDQIDEKLKKNNIEIIRHPNFEKTEFIIDEIKLKEYIKNEYKNNSPFPSTEIKDSTILKDVDSFASIFRLREGKKETTINKVKYIFITTNYSLANATRKFEKDMEYGGEHWIPLFVTDVFFGTLLWMRNPNKAMEINGKRIMANVYSSLQPDEELLKKYLFSLEKMKDSSEITEEEYITYRDHSSFRTLLVDKTMGDAHNFTIKTALEVIEEQKDRAREEGKIEFNKKLKEAENKIKEQDGKLNSAEIKMSEQEKKIFEKNNKISEINLNSEKLARRIVMGSKIFCIFIIIAIYIFIEIKKTGTTKIVCDIIIFFISLLDIFSIFIPKIKRKFEDWVYIDIFKIKSPNNNK